MKNLILFIVGTFFFLHNVEAQDQIVYKTKNLAKPDTTWVFKPKNYTSK